MPLRSLKVGDYMSRHPAILTPHMPIEEAVAKLIAADLTGGPVIDATKRVVGFLSEQDCLGMMLEGTYHNEQSANVEDCMNNAVLTIFDDMDVLDLAQKLGANKPKVYPVVDHNNRLVGVISRTQVLKAIHLHLKDAYRK